VTEVQGTWSESALPVPNQGPGSGSCGIVSISTIHSFLDPDVVIWSQETALQFRLDWLQQLLRHHLAAARSQEETAVSQFLIEICHWKV
jgi:hypothetical protein